LRVEGATLQSPADVAPTLNYYFVESVATIASSFIAQEENALPTVNTSEPAAIPKSVSETEVAEVIANLKSSRAKDIYGMDTFMLKDINSSIVNAYH